MAIIRSSRGGGARQNKIIGETRSNIVMNHSSLFSESAIEAARRFVERKLTELISDKDVNYKIKKITAIKTYQELKRPRAER